jgi:UDP-2,3-diacylglucosamine pyrophosphatase LpxH
VIRTVTGKRAIFIPDVHVPYQDPNAVTCGLEFIRDFKPHYVFIIGDFCDFYAISRFSREPARRLTLQDELNDGKKLLHRIAQATPKAERYYLQGNHEMRLRKFLYTTASELSGLSALTIPELLDLKRTGFTYVESGWMEWHGILVKHGNLVSPKAGYSAHREMERNGMSGVSGHTHRCSKVSMRNQGGFYTWVEIGTWAGLCPTYLEGMLANWCHGIGFAYVKTTGELFELDVKVIVDGKMLFGDKQFS